jgi:transposase InsO family protein
MRLGFEVCTTAPYSPESNGMAEAFVKTFKRDYAHLSDLKSEDDVLYRLPTWFEDYNENAPHKGLKMMSPREYRRTYQLTDVYVLPGATPHTTFGDNYGSR